MHVRVSRLDIVLSEKRIDEFCPSGSVAVQQGRGGGRIVAAT